MKPRICYLGGARYSQPLDPTSAAKFRVLGQIGEIYVVGFCHSVKWRRFLDSARFYLLPQLPMPWMRYLEFTLFSPLIMLWLMARRDLRIFIAQSPYEAVVPACLKLFLAWWGLKIALIVESHGDFEESVFLHRRLRAAGLRRRLMKLLTGFSLKRADSLRAVSDSTRQQLESWTKNKAIVQFPAWTNIRLFLEAATAKPDSRTVLYAGVLVPGKGLHFLLTGFARVVERIPEARLLIAGEPRTRDYSRKIEQMVAHFELGANVRFLGHLPQAELAGYMARASLLVLPSLSEGLGRVLLEAMACATPVVASRVGGIAEIVFEGENGLLVSVGDSDGLAEGMLRILQDPAMAREMGRKGRRFVQTHFSDERYLAGYERLFDLAARALQASTSADSAKRSVGPH